MRALVFDHGKAAVRDVRRPAPRKRFALVRVLLSGICNTDLELKRGYQGFSGIPGHEFVGVVEGPASSPLFGKRVVGEINLGWTSTRSFHRYFLSAMRFAPSACPRAPAS